MEHGVFSYILLSTVKPLINAPWKHTMWGCGEHFYLSGAFYGMKIGPLLRKLWPKSWKMTILGSPIGELPWNTFCTCDTDSAQFVMAWGKHGQEHTILNDLFWTYWILIVLPDALLTPNSIFISMSEQLTDAHAFSRISNTARDVREIISTSWRVILSPPHSNPAAISCSVDHWGSWLASSWVKIEIKYSVI